MTAPALVRATSSDIASLGLAKDHVGASENNLRAKFATIAEAFPDVDPGLKPCGSMLLVQIRQAPRKTAGGILLTPDNRRDEWYNTEIARVHSMGPVAFHNRDDMTEWPERAWCRVGDFVKIDKYQTKRHPVEFRVKDKDHLGRDVEVVDEVVFALLKDLAVLGVYTVDPLTVKSFYS